MDNIAETLDNRRSLKAVLIPYNFEIEQKFRAEQMVFVIRMTRLDFQYYAKSWLACRKSD